MRIVIEIDGTATEQPDASQTMPSAPDPASAPTDGGAGPGVNAASGVEDSDSGGPSQELLSAVGEAERASGSSSPHAHALDAGAGPTNF